MFEKTIKIFSAVVMLILLLITVFNLNIAGASDQIPASPQKLPVAVTGAVIHTVANGDIVNGTILFENGKITGLGTSVSIPGNAIIIDAKGKHVYPALIETSSTIGLSEIGAVKATQDFSEIGTINPNVRAESSINPDSEIIPVTRANGIGLAVAMPSGGLLSGKAALIMLDGWTWEEMVVKAPVGMVLNWPAMNLSDSYGLKQTNEEALKKIKGQLDELDDIFRKARAYKTAIDAAGDKDIPYHGRDLRWESLIPVLKGELPVFVNSSTKLQIEAAVRWSEKEKVKIVIVGGSESPKCADLLREKGIPVIINPVLRLPSNPDYGYDEAYLVPVKLYNAGVKFCIANGDDGFGNNRNLPYQAAMAAAFGLPKDIALKSVTQFSAQILGVDDITGTIENGKDATIIITDGDPLEFETHVERMFIKGKDIDLSSRHTTLYEKYRKRYFR